MSISSSTNVHSEERYVRGEIVFVFISSVTYFITCFASYYFVNNTIAHDSIYKYSKPQGWAVTEDCNMNFYTSIYIYRK